VTDGTGPSLSINSLTFFGGLSATQAANDISVANVTTLAGSGTGNTLVKTGTPSAYVTKDLKAGTGISLTVGADDITVVNTDLGSAVTLTSAGGTETLVNDGTGPALAIKGITAGTGISLSGAATALTITNSDPASGVALTNAGTGTSLVSDGAGPSLSNNSISAGSSISLTSASSNVAIAVNMGTASSDQYVSVSTTGSLQRAAVDLETYYYVVVQDIDGDSTRLSDILVQSTSAGGGAYRTTTLSANAFSNTSYAAGTNTDWKDPATGDIYTLTDESGYLTRSNWTITVGNALAAGLYWVTLRWIGQSDSATVRGLMWGVFFGTEKKTGIYSRGIVDNTRSYTFSCDGLVELANGDAIKPMVICSGGPTLDTAQLYFCIRRYSSRQAPPG
jgi:hypothetical protein